LTMPGTESRISVLCVDDNPHVVDALRLKLSSSLRFEWMGSLPSADDLIQTVARQGPSIVILDLDMPGKSPLAVVAELAQICPDIRVVVFSGHVREELVRHALEAGVWGYASKNDGEEELVKLLIEVAGGHMSLSPSVRAASDAT
jgi:DNA-binding NarL/FixJ family response regulator